MRPNPVRIIGLLAGSLVLSGCPLALVGVGVAGGYAISKDSVRNQFDLSKGHVFQQSVAVIEDMGLITTQDEQRGIIKAKVEDANVIITVKPLTKKTVELKIKARNDLMMPKIGIAQDVYNRIVENL